MKLFFDRNKFIKNAPSNIKQSLNELHLSVLNGKEVCFKEDKYGRIDYDIENDEVSYYLYPVDKEWCSNKQQVKLF